MMRIIIYKEFFEHLSSFRMMLSSSIIIILFIINALINSYGYNKDLDKYYEIKNKNGQQLIDASDQLVNLVHVKQIYLKPPSKLSFISNGNQERLPNGIELDYFSVSNPIFVKCQNIFFNKFQAIDWSFILIYIVSFVCISITYDTISGEKVNGTLKLISSNNIGRGKILLGKYIGTMITIIFPILIGIIINLIILQFNHKINLKVDDYLNIILYIVIAFTFVSLNVILGFFISSLTNKSILSLSILLSIWIVLVIVYPNISWLISKRIVNISSVSETEIQEKQRIDELYKSDKYSLSWNSSWNGQPPHELVEKRVAGVNEQTRIHNLIWEDYRDKMFKQTDLSIKISKLSPYFLFDNMGVKISDNGFYGYKNFYRQIKQYFDQYNKFINEKDKSDNNSYHLIWNEPDWRIKYFMSTMKVNNESIPQFRYKLIKGKQLLTSAFFDIFILCMWNITLFVLCFMVFRNYDVR